MGKTLSHTVNELFGAYVAIEREQDRLATAGLEAGASALGEPALEARDKILALRDRSGNPDLIAARVMADLMLLHSWRKIETGEGVEWSLDDREVALPLLEAVSDLTTGVVREHTRLALATIGVDIEPKQDLNDFEPYPVSLLKALPSDREFSRRHMVTIRLAAALAVKTKSELVEAFAKEPNASLEFHETADGTAVFLRALADLCDVAAARVLSAGAAYIEATEERA